MPGIFDFGLAPAPGPERLIIPSFIVTVLSGVERSGPPGGGPARVAQTGAGGRGGSAGQTNRHGESADQEILIRRDVGDEPAGVSNGGV